MFPMDRLRRLRRTPLLRRMVQETTLTVNDLIYPMFVQEGTDIQKEIASMPGQYRYSVDRLVPAVEEVIRQGIPAIMLFGIPAGKDDVGSGAYAEDGIVQRALRALKEAYGSDLLLIADVCLCEYTSHGHCGVLHQHEVDNDATLRLLGTTAVRLAQAGADMVAPSAMMDGQVMAIRKALDEAGFSQIPILSYAAKFASSFYGPFREAAESAPGFGDRRGYQMDPHNAREALRELLLDDEEGADILMVKPAMPYLDVLRQARQHTLKPLAAYQVSGEYAMLKAAIHRGWLSEQEAILESLISIKRAGADLILTYFALEVAPWL